MDLATITAGVLLGNLITFALVWNLRKLDAVRPPMFNLLALFFTLLVVFLIGLAASDFGQAAL